MSRSQTRSTARRAIPAVVGAAALVAGAVAATAAPSHASVIPTYKQLTAVPGLASLTDLGSVAATKPMTIGIQVRTDAAKLDAAYAAVVAGTHSAYTPAEVAADFGPSSTDSAAVASFLKGSGLKTAYASRDGSYLLLSGTAAQLEKTFKVALHSYSVNGTTYVANTTGATVPTAVTSVLGLESFTDMKVGEDQDTCLQVACVGALSPTALWSAYGMPAASTGQGQKIAIFGEGDTTQPIKDLRQFEGETTVGLSDATKPVLPQVPVVTHLINDPQTDTSGLGEWDLDTQSSTGMSPDLAELDLYFGSDLSDDSIAATYNAWIGDDDGPAIGNSSFGGCEPLDGLLGTEATLDAPLERAVLEGRTMFVSTGDTGSGGCVPILPVNGLGNGGAPAVEYPAASPYVVAVGGTVLYTKTDSSGAQVTPATRSLEYAWTYTGGGVSLFEKRPYVQAQVKGIPSIPCVTTTGKCRIVPDVAALSGDVLTNGYAIVSDGANSQSGGTSLSSPLWAGMWARIRAAHPVGCNQYGTGTGQLGFAQTLLYDVANAGNVDKTDFFDIGGTSNSLPVGNGAYVAEPRVAKVNPTGFDLVSGLGVPNVAALSQTLNCGSVTAQ